MWNNIFKHLKLIIKEPILIFLILLYSIIYVYIYLFIFIITLGYFLFNLVKILYYYLLSYQNNNIEFIIEINIWDPIVKSIYIRYIWVFFYLKPYLQSRFYLYKLFSFKQNFKKIPLNLKLLIFVKFILYYIYILITGLTKPFMKYLKKLINLYFNIKTVKNDKNKEAFIYSFLEKYWTNEIDDLFYTSKLEIRIKNNEINFILV